MNTLPQSDTRTTTRPVRIPEDCWEALRTDAFENRTSITRVLAVIIRRKYRIAIEPAKKTA